MHRYQHKFTHAFYILPSIFVEWLDKDGKREYTICSRMAQVGILLGVINENKKLCGKTCPNF